MSRPVFVDTDAFLALANQADQYHLKATAYLSYLGSIRARFVTSNFVLDETYTRVRRRAGLKTAITFGEKIQAGDEIKVVTIDRGLEKQAWEIFKRYSDHDFSYTDCTSFALMKKMHLSSAFAFDSDFQIFGFEIVKS